MMNESRAVDPVPAYPLEVLAEALVHLLWQGVGVGLVVLLFLLLARGIRAAARARALGACLLVFPLILLVTWFVSSPGEAVRGGSPAGDVDWAWVRGLLAAWVAWMPPWPWVLGAWACGVLALGLRTGAGILRLRRLARAVDGLDEQENSTPDSVARHPAWPAFVAKLESGPTPCRVVWISAGRLEVPCTLGVRRPRILVPRSLLESEGGGDALGIDDLLLILEHEWAHVRRRDFLANLGQVAVEVVFFFHPVVWWISRRLRIEREFACDDEAVASLSTTAGAPRRYVRALARLAERQGRVPAWVPSAVGGSVAGRMGRLLERPVPPDTAGSSSPWARALSLLPAVGGLVLSVGAVGLAPPKAPGVPSYLDPSKEPCFELPFVGPFGHHGSWEVFYGEGFRFRPGPTRSGGRSGSTEVPID